MKNAYRQWLADLDALEQKVAAIGADDLIPPGWITQPPDAPVALVCSPHPDDEAITGGLALRLRREGWRVVNVAITLGSNPTRRSARLEELERCCTFLGFELEIAGGLGLEGIRPERAAAEPDRWRHAAGILAEIFRKCSPRVLIFPHKADFHPTHCGTHLLVHAALEQAQLPTAPWLVESEFWAQMSAPNLLIGSSPDDVALILAGLRQHVGEVSRNPYHLRLPGWLSDNVRRGSEVLAGAGSAAANFAYGTLYRRSRASAKSGPLIIPPSGRVSDIFSV